MSIFAQKKPITPPEFAGREAPYSPGLIVDGTLYVSGQVGANLQTRELPADFETEVKQCLQNIGYILKAAGMGFEHVISVNVYLTDISLFARMNAVYAPAFPVPRPARTTVEVSKLPSAGARIEISLIARK